MILLVGALFVAGITAFMARSLMQGASAPQATAQVVQKVDGPEVLVATRALPVMLTGISPKVRSIVVPLRTGTPPIAWARAPGGAIAANPPTAANP